MPKTTAFMSAVLLNALLFLPMQFAYAVHPVQMEPTPIEVPQHCQDPGDTSQACRSLFALAQFVGFQNTPDYLFFVTHQLNHDYQLVPLQTATSLNQDPSFIASHNDYLNGVITREQQADTMVSLVNDVLKSNLEQLGVTDFVSAQYHTTRMRILSNLALANRHRQRGMQDNQNDTNEAVYLSHTLLQPDPAFMQTLSLFSDALSTQRQHCLQGTTAPQSSEFSCASLHMIGESFSLQPTHQLEKILAKLEGYVVEDLAPTAAQRITVSAELDSFDGYALSQLGGPATYDDESPAEDTQNRTAKASQLNEAYHAKNLALQALHDANLAQLQQDGLALHTVGQGVGARMSEYAMVATSTGIFDSLVDIYKLSQHLLQIWQPDATDATPSKLPFAQTRSRIEYWVGVEDDVFDLLMQLHAQRNVESEYQMILTQAGVQAWDLRPVVSQIYRNSDPNDYINVMHTGYTLPIHFNESSTLFRWRMNRAD